MKHITFILAFILFAGLTFAQETETKSFAEFKKLSHDFGKITDQEDAVYKFEFTNTTGEALILNPPKTSCGCTTPYYPKEPIASGDTAEIEVKYSTKNRIGKFLKDIKVYAQGFDDPIVLKIKGEVVSPQEISTLPKKQNNSLFK